MAAGTDKYEGSAIQIARDEETVENVARWQSIGKSWEDMLHAAYRQERQGIALRRISIRVGWITGVDSLLTLVGDSEEGSVVAFHGAESPTTMWSRLAKRWMTGGLEWKEDRYERK